MPLRHQLLGPGYLALLCLLLQVMACATPARTDQMKVVEHAVSTAEQSVSVEERLTIAVTVYGDNVGGFASHYYPLPRADFEKALLESLSKSGRYAPLPRGSDANFRLSVGLIQLIAPQWSGTVTLETSWAIFSALTGEEIARRSIRVQNPASFSKKREATESVAHASIVEAIGWIDGVIGAKSSDIRP